MCWICRCPIHHIFFITIAMTNDVFPILILVCDYYILFTDACLALSNKAIPTYLKITDNCQLYYRCIFLYNILASWNWFDCNPGNIYNENSGVCEPGTSTCGFSTAAIGKLSDCEGGISTCNLSTAAIGKLSDCEPGTSTWSLSIVNMLKWINSLFYYI